MYCADKDIIGEKGAQEQGKLILWLININTGVRTVPLIAQELIFPWYWFNKSIYYRGIYWYKQSNSEYVYNLNY